MAGTGGTALGGTALGELAGRRGADVVQRLGDGCGCLTALQIHEGAENCGKLGAQEGLGRRAGVSRRAR